MFFDNSPDQILAYLQEQLPDYPYRADLDTGFVAELAARLSGRRYPGGDQDLPLVLRQRSPGSRQEHPRRPAPLDR